MAHKAAYEEYAEELVKGLPMDDPLFVANLHKHKLLPGNTNSKIEALSTAADKSSYFLNCVVKKALDVNDTSSFNKLLSVMKRCGYQHVKNLAHKIESKIDGANDIEPDESSVGVEHHLISKRKRGRSDTVTSHISSKSLEGVDSQHSDRDEDHVQPQPKKCRKEKVDVTKKLSKACNLKEYEKKFNENNVESSFVYMLDKLEKLWSDVEIPRLKSSCERDGRLPKKYKKKLKSTKTLGEIFDLLSNTPFCTWLDIRILKSMADVADIPEATQMIAIFEKCVYYRKCFEVAKYFKKQYINPDYFTKVRAKLNKYAEQLVADLIEDCQKLESILQLPSESNTLVGGGIGCLELHLVIPKYCHLHAYESLKSRFFKLRPLNFQYLQVGSLPKVYTTNLTTTTQAKSLLTEISSHDDWSSPLQVIDHYYTYLEGHMDADSVSHMMHSEQLITDSDYEVITAAPNDINMNRLLLQYVRAMDMPKLLKFCNLLKQIETHHSIGDNLDTSLKSTKWKETEVLQTDFVFSVPTKLMTSQFKGVNTIFLEVIDKLAALVQAVDMEFLADKCLTLMASDIHNIKLFTDGFMKKLFRCSHPNLLKMYLLPFNTWFDNTILIELATAYETNDTLELLCKFIRIIDDAEPVTSYPIPTFSQLIIPLDDSEYTIVAIKTFKNCNELALKDVTNVKEFLKSHWELTAHAIQLAAIDYFHNFIYWMIPKQVQWLVENKLTKGQYELWHGGIFMAVLLPNGFFSADYDFNQQMISNPFNVMLKDSVQACEIDLDTLKTCADLLQEENSELISQLNETQELLMKSEVEKEEYLNKYKEFKDKEKCDVAIQNDMETPDEMLLLKSSHLLGSGIHGKTYSILFKGELCTVKLLYGKLLKPNQSTEHLVSEFNEKCTVCLGLNHSNLVKFIEVTQINTEVAIINKSMQMNLPTYIKQKGSDFSLSDQVSLCLDMSNGLCELHNHSILHKNLHDGNVLVQDNRAKISDFYYSLLQLVEDDQHFVVPYVAPEIKKGFPLSYATSSDIYSLGVLLLQVITSSAERASLEQAVNSVTEDTERQTYKEGFHVVLHGLVDYIYRCLSIKTKSRPSVTEMYKYIKGAPQYVSFRALHQEENSPAMLKLLEEGEQLKWRDCCPLPSRMWGATAVVLNNIIYVSGGESPDDFVGHFVFAYHLLENSWETLPKLQGHSHGIPVVAGGELYVIGGKGYERSKKYSDKVSKYDNDKQKWKSYPHLQLQRFQPLALAYNDYIIVAGGKYALTFLGSFYDDRVHDDIEIINIKDPEMKWKTVPTRLPMGMWAPSATISNDYLWIASFNHGQRMFFNVLVQRSNEVFQISVTDIFTSENKVQHWTRLKQLVPYYDATVVPNTSPLVLVGGVSQDITNAKIVTNALMKHEPSRDYWDKIGSLDGPSRAYTTVACIGKQQAIVVMGGCTETTDDNARNSSCLSLVQIGYVE